MIRSAKPFWLTIIPLLWLAFLLRVWGLDFGLPYRYHPDEVQYADAALKWYTEGELRLHFVNPPLFLYILVAVFWPWIKLSPVTFSQAWVAQSLLFARLWSIFFGMLTIALTYKVGQRFLNRKTGLVALILLAGLFLPARESHFAVNDTTVTFLVLLAIYFSLSLLWRRHWSTYAAAGVAIGMAAAAKLTGGVAILGLLAAHFAIRPTILKFRAHIKLLVGLTAALATFLVVSLPFLWNSVLFLEDVIKHLEYGVAGYKGARMAPATGWQFYVQVLGWGIGWLLLAVIVVALVQLVRQRSRPGIVLVVFPITLFVYMGSQKILFARFFLPAIPPLVILAAGQLVTWQAQWEYWRRRPILVWSGVIGLILVQPLTNLIWFNHLLTLPDTRQIATNWLREQFAENTIVVMENYSVFPELHLLNEPQPYKIMEINERSDTNDDRDHYLSRPTQLVILSNYTFDRVRQEPLDESMRQAQLAYLDANAELIKEFSPYHSGYNGWFYQDQIYGPAGETLQRLRPGPLIKVYRPHRPRPDDLNISVPAEANFANQLYLLGYDLPQKQVEAGQAFPITLYWQAPADKSPEANFIQFNHFLDNTGTLRGGYDRQPLEYYSTDLWTPGEIVIDGYTVPVDADAPPGQYYLNVGYYLTVEKSAVTLPLVTDGQMTDITSVTIGPIEVLSP